MNSYSASTFSYAIYIVLVASALLVSSTEFTHDRKRLGDPTFVKAEHGCLQKYKVRESSIIRTEDSKALGAKFLNESDVGNREDCLNLCCNTPRCNVAVFEENSPFSCYLFDCGDLSDFRCRFTTHSYYTSALLNREQLELGIWSAQHKHEADLSNLRSSLGVPQVSDGTQKTVKNISYFMPSVSAFTTSTPLPVTTTTPQTLRPQPVTEKNCRLYEFECDNKECVAIYNVCDGIPQCQDGSDESEKLNCPNGSLTNLTPPEKQEVRLPSSRENWNGGSQAGVFNHRSTLLDYNHRNEPNYQTNERVMYDNHDTDRKIFDYNQRGPWPNTYNTGPEQEAAHRELTQLYPGQFSDYGFHGAKDATLQPKPMYHPHVNPRPNITYQNYGPNVPSSYNQQEAALWNRQGFNPPPTPLPAQTHNDSPYSGFMRTERPPVAVAANVQQQQPVIPATQQPPVNRPIQQIVNITHKLDSQGKSKPAETLSAADKATVNSTSLATNSDHIATSTAKEIIKPIPHGSLTPKDSLVSSNNSKGKQRGNSLHSEYLSLSQLGINLHELEDKDAEQSSQASGAVLALSLGICISVLMVVLVGCRMQGTKRRVRRYRGRSKLEHDADYLVNGMYL